jgi:hypothetical protein
VYGFEIYTISTDGIDRKAVTDGSLSWMPAWQPGGTNPHKVSQIVGGDDGSIPDMGGWKRGRFVFGSYHGNWDVAVVSDSGGEITVLTDHPEDGKPSDWWVS